VLGVSKGKKSNIAEKVRNPTVKWHSNSLAEIYVSCGSPCNYSWFYSPVFGVSSPIQFVLAVAPTKNIVVSAGLDELEIIQIFGDIKKPLQTIKRDFHPTAALVLVLEDVKFIDEGHLQIRYMASGSEYSKEPNPNVTERRFVTTKKGKEIVWLEKTEVIAINIK